MNLPNDRFKTYERNRRWMFAGRGIDGREGNDRDQGKFRNDGIANMVGAMDVEIDTGTWVGERIKGS
jgi:hypothetical protein